MTPFGERLRALRAERGITLKAMAAQLGLSPAYLSALEHGRRGRPTHALVVAVEMRSHQSCDFPGVRSRQVVTAAANDAKI